MTSMLSDMELRDLLSACVYILGPVRRWHGHQNQLLRSADKCREWYMQMALKGGRPLLLSIAGMQQDPELVSVCRLWSSGPLPSGLTLPIAVDHPFVVAQNELAKRLGALIESLLNHFLRGFAWHVDGWPGGFAALLHPDASPPGHMGFFSVMSLFASGGGSHPAQRVFRRTPCFGSGEIPLRRKRFAHIKQLLFGPGGVLL